MCVHAAVCVCEFMCVYVTSGPGEALVKRMCWGKPGPLRFGCSDCTGPDGDNGMSFCQLLG